MKINGKLSKNDRIYLDKCKTTGFWALVIGFIGVVFFLLSGGTSMASLFLAFWGATVAISAGIMVLVLVAQDNE